MSSLLIFLIELYRKFVSPLKGAATCRYYPTCSQYAILAIKKHGIFLGTLKAIYRVLRCNPFSKGGIDYP